MRTIDEACTATTTTSAAAAAGDDDDERDGEAAEAREARWAALHEVLEMPCRVRIPS
jgi:hypothetical protein